MSAKQDQVRLIAERIARRVSQGEGHGTARTAENSGGAADDLASVRATLDELKRKLISIEENLAHETENSSSELQPSAVFAGAPQAERGAPSVGPTAAHSPWLSGMYVPAAHPSEEKFGVEEAAVSELVDFFEKEKICELEPGGKPCNHCAMCNTRGF